ncbi:Endonuclease/Exonuclease/phosphatase family protein [Colwellia chukchiensis]|uniref:Endonuclease/Exonuclease/phosphatase family protein n=2 Tax=Colwellia chukchiensis TaxID=641665 RepID=A0A1H7SRV1_9GAMM|nr:endonuclease/exonuclease/phosphatase family protein [Colwellia chukchiensis]SEL75119.1 Endonuclease/Exonuclease/phosphatase family protein [Colwellia chukchiensis]
MFTTQAATVRVATFNVSMEALNYLPANTKPSGHELAQALRSNHQQIKNIAEIIQRVNPDIILLNEFDGNDNQHQALKQFLQHYLAKSQNGQAAINYPYFYQGPVNTGVATGYSLKQENTTGTLPNDAYGYGHFSGHFAMTLLSKHPINHDKVRTFQHFKWRDMPNALKPIDPENQKPWYTEHAWQNFRLSSKSHWDIPITINGDTLHILASHPTPPVFDGPEDRNGKRNFDEIRFWIDYLTPSKSAYIYDDNRQFGGLSQDQAFIILGDLNADAVDGDAIKAGIQGLLNHPRVLDPKPLSIAGKMQRPDNPNAQYHTAYWGLRADYVLPAKKQLNVLNSGIFWPTSNEESYKLIKDRAASSDHRLVWVDVAFSQ